MDSGTQLVGMVVMICCQTRVPMPRKTHQVHCSTVRGEVVNAGPPNWIIIICKGTTKCEGFTPDWWKLDSFVRTDLTDERDDPDCVVNRVRKQSHEHVSLAVDLPGVDLIEEGHHDERVEYHSEMLRWRCVEAGALAVFDVEDNVT